MVDQVGVEVLDLLLGELDVLEPGDDLVVGEEPLLGSLLDKLLKLFDFRKSDIDGEHGSWSSPSRATGRLSVDLPAATKRAGVSRGALRLTFRRRMLVRPRPFGKGSCVKWLTARSWRRAEARRHATPRPGNRLPSVPRRGACFLLIGGPTESLQSLHGELPRPSPRRAADRRRRRDGLARLRRVAAAALPGGGEHPRAGHDRLRPPQLHQRRRRADRDEHLRREPPQAGRALPRGRAPADQRGRE